MSVINLSDKEYEKKYEIQSKVAVQMCSQNFCNSKTPEVRSNSIFLSFILTKEKIQNFIIFDQK